MPSVGIGEGDRTQHDGGEAVTVDVEGSGSRGVLLLESFNKALHGCRGVKHKVWEERKEKKTSGYEWRSCRHCCQIREAEWKLTVNGKQL